VGIGYLAADKINEQVDKIVPKKKDATTGVETPNQNIAMAGELGLGGLLLLKKMPVKNKLVRQGITVAGGVLAGAGLKRALKELGVISGYQSVPVIGRRRMAGYQEVPVIGGVPAQLQGVPAQLQGYVSQGSGAGMGAYVNQGSGVMGSVMSGSGSGIMSSSDFMG